MQDSRAKYLIVNADDFGYSPGVNAGILRAHADGIVTSTSVMVRWPAAASAKQVAVDFPRLALGLHVDLGEWAYKDGAWSAQYLVLRDGARDESQVSAEVARQLDAFREIVGRDPSHMDSHQHVHREEPLRSVMRRMADRMGIPLRHFSPRVRHVGEFYGQAGNGAPHADGVSVANLIRIISELPDGVVELGCHPGLASDHTSAYRTEREMEVRTLCDAHVRAALAEADVHLISFEDIRDL